MMRLATIDYREVWLSPDGDYYDGDAHENRAEEILNELYGMDKDDILWAGDTLEDLGWIRLTTSCMWEIRIDQGYFNNRTITQKQLDCIYDWCLKHNKILPLIFD